MWAAFPGCHTCPSLSSLTTSFFPDWVKCYRKWIFTATGKLVFLRSACESSWESQTKEGCYSEHRHLLNWVSCCLSLEPEPACSGSCFLTVCKPQSTPHPFAYKGGGSCVCSHRQRRNILFLSFRIVVNNVGAGKSWDANLIWSYTKPV